MQCIGEVGGGLQRRGIGDESLAQRLIDLVVEVTSSHVPLVGEEQVATQRMQALALVELATDSPAKLLGQVAADVDRAHEPATLMQSLARVLCRLPACSLAISRLAVVCPNFIDPTRRSKSFQWLAISWVWIGWPSSARPRRPAAVRPAPVRRSGAVLAEASESF